MSRNRNKTGIPDRWLDYKPVGRRLLGTRFVAFKVPLKQSLTRQLSGPDVFGPWELQDTLTRDNQELGLIIDLTFTTRYYNLQDVPDSLLCVKIFTAGHEVPSDDTILSFKRVVRRFLLDNADNDQLIGVHCTHGLNRTGYLICRYLIDVDGMDPKEAVELFNSSRGHNIERKNYLEDLQRGPKRSNMGIEKSEQEPMRGLASHRPLHCDSREDRRAHLNKPSHHSGTNHRSHHLHPHDGLLPSPPPFYPPTGALHHPYRWAPPHPDSQWRRAPRSEDSWSRYPSAERGWSQSSHRGPPSHRSQSSHGSQSSHRGPPSRGSPSSSHWQQDRRRAPPLPRYSPRWTSETHRVNTYDN